MLAPVYVIGLVQARWRLVVRIGGRPEKQRLTIGGVSVEVGKLLAVAAFQKD
jgi:hypothetical protein